METAERRNEDPCERVQGRLEELLDGGLAPLEAARDEGHLEVCCACAREAASWRALLSVARRAGRPTDAEVAQALLGMRLPRPELSTPPRGSLRAPLAAAFPLLASAAALVALLALRTAEVPLPGVGALGELALRGPLEVPQVDWSGILGGAR
jgi:anti-sigma factor RsiW